MAYSKQFIDELKNTADIYDIVSKYVELKHSGSNYSGRCPFHSERTASFTLYSDHYYCYGCGAGGDVITFMMAIENLEYRDAVEKLAEQYGIPLPIDNDRFVKKETVSKERCYELNLAVAKFYYECLVGKGGEKARLYLEERRISKATSTHFGLGYAPDGFSATYDHLISLGFTLEEIKAASICGISKNGRPYDFFRNRIMFPIIDVSGRIVAFGGRRIDGVKEQKYINSSDTPIYNKRKNLYALNFAKNAATGQTTNTRSRSGELILCEGNIDVVSLHQAGFTGAVATLGTAITPDQARLMARFAKTVFISYDADAAGINATNKAIKCLTEAGIDVKVLRIPDGKDPDDYIKKHGAEAFAELLKGSSGEIDYKIGELLKKYNINNADDKLRLLKEACGIFAYMGAGVKREVYIRRLAEMTDIPADSIRNETERISKNLRAGEKRRIARDGENMLKHYGDSINPEASRYPKETAIEERILGIILLYPEFIKSCPELTKDTFVTSFSAELFENITSIELDEFDISLLNEKYSPDEMGGIMTMASKRRMLSVNSVDLLKDQISLLSSLKTESARQKASELSDDEWLERLQSKGKNKNYINTKENSDG